ncbi:Nuclear transport factor 2 [Mycena venus]|uniref:NTF2-related export protein n=1 Tax=Mycena venus TaxID=2733690 RepID=A0A8H6Y7M6_9AGAR|nr:Nuclear transport factor 2 [Mycena venus]
MADIDAVSRQFVDFYYQTFDTDRNGLAPLYRNTSMLTFEGTQTMGGAAIVEKLARFPLIAPDELIRRAQSLPFQKVQHKVTTKDAQPSSQEVASLLVSVTGLLVVDDSPNPLQFSQIFHLIPEGGSYYVFNDIFRLNYA